jgi:microcystin-dependent protein
MAEPFIGEIKFFSFAFPPKNWAPCNGQQLAIAQNQALFSLLGTTFGGNGVTTFALPDLRGRVPMHSGSTTPQGATGGVENVTLNITQIPTHAHQVNASDTAGSQKDFNNAIFADGSSADAKLYEAPGALQNLNPAMVSNAGGNQPHTNLQPSLVGNYCIALAGIYPSRN